MSEEKRTVANGPFYVVNYSFINDRGEIKTGRLGVQAKDEKEARSLAMDSLRGQPEKKAPLLTKVRLY